MKVQIIHRYGGCNRVVNALDWGSNDLVAYASHNQVVIYNVQEAKVLSTIKGHTARVNCVKWINPPVHGLVNNDGNRCDYLCSGSCDNTIGIWQYQRDSRRWKNIAMLKGHEGPIICLTLHRPPKSQREFYLVSCAGESSVRVWVCKPSMEDGLGQSCWSLYDLIHVGFQLQMCADLTFCPGNSEWLLLGSGGVDGSVRLFLCAPSGSFKQVCKLVGHENWIRGLAFQHIIPSQREQSGYLLLASASQDRYVRIWKIGSDINEDSVTAKLTRFAPKTKFQVGDKELVATIEALLVGHEDYVHSVQWQPTTLDGVELQNSRLLSSSMDRTMTIWGVDAGTGLWLNLQTVGDAGSTNLGYFGGCWKHDNSSIIAHGFKGALHLWTCSKEEGVVKWKGQHALGGHCGPVVDMHWGFDRNCLITASTDQTVRITTKFQNSDGKWAEIARPQIHGHDFSCLATLRSPSGDPKFYYVSGSEEKVIRVFESPTTFLRTLQIARGVPVEEQTQAQAPFGASVAALGLSNKAVYENNNNEVKQQQQMELELTGDASYAEGPDFVPASRPHVVQGPPLEEHLQQNTLWPEIHKLYGHGNDLYALEASSNGKYLASACKAQTQSAADVWIWNTNNWQSGIKLKAHYLTVTQMEFSPDNQWLASVGRDRTFAVYSCHDNDFKLTRTIQKAHDRIIWGVSWSYNSALLATCSRDKTVKVWIMSNDLSGPCNNPIITIQTSVSATCVAFCPWNNDNEDSQQQTYLLAVGLESGQIILFSLEVNLTIEQYQQLWLSDECGSHCATVKRLRWKQDVEFGGYLLASCGDDYFVNIFGVQC